LGEKMLDGNPTAVISDAALKIRQFFSNPIPMFGPSAKVIQITETGFAEQF
jgi:hypothetical protein